MMGPGISSKPPAFFHSTKPALTSSPSKNARSISMTAVVNDDEARNTPDETASVYSYGSAQSPPKSVRSVMDDDEDEEEEEEGGDVQWEEEATPDQTAFGKRLLFQRVSHDADEVSSTASENGSIIQADEKLKEVDRMLQHEHLSLPLLEENNDDMEEKGKDTIPRSPSKSTSNAISEAIKRIASSTPGTPSSVRTPLSSPRRIIRNISSKPSTPDSRQIPLLSPIRGGTAFSPFRRTPLVDTSHSPGTESAASAYAEATSGRERDLLPRRRQPPKPFLPVRSCFSLDVSDSAIPYREMWTSKSWDIASTFQRGTATTTSTPKQQDTKRQLLKTPERIEIERDDALDILSCLVEQGVSWKSDDRGAGSASMKEEAAPTDPITPHPEHDSGVPCTIKPVQSQIEIAAVVRELQQQLPSIDAKTSQQRKDCLEELLRSYEYALEMKRATKSASSWLRSIGRSSSETVAATPISDTGTVQTEMTEDDTIDMLAVRAQLHAAQLEAKERSEAAQRLNEELAQCRAEIGRLRTQQRTPQLNRSVLDDDDDDTDENNDVVMPMKGDTVLYEESNVLTASFLREHETEHDELHQCKFALTEAQKTIEALRLRLGEKADALTSLVDTPSHSETSQSMVDWKTLETENIDTDWGELTPPIPFLPPEHELRSPIVTAVLEAWTDDIKLQDSLLNWMEEVLAGNSRVPPLTLSGLDHQVRDGFCVHILPLLFTKPEIRVGIQSRLQRRTTYDIAVTVEPRLSEEDDSFNASTATTALVSNRDSARLSYDEFAEPNLQSPDDAEEAARVAATWTSTLGGALWGSLTSTRRKIIADVEEPYHRVVSAPAGRIGVTFVEYRGHCMVSDVAADSPLLNWVFPSDVLIAIDELAVSGMRVRDIIKVLKERSARQRALRVVSSHAMSELTGST